MDSQSTITALQEILNSRREILALLIEIQERKRQQAAPFRAIQVQNGVNSQDDEYDEPGISSESFKAQNCNNSDDCRYQRKPEDEQTIIKGTTDFAVCSSTQTQTDSTICKQYDKACRHSNIVVSNQNDSIIDTNIARTSNQRDKKQTDSIVLRQSDKASGQTNSEKTKQKDGIISNHHNESNESSNRNSRTDHLKTNISDSKSKSEENLRDGDICVVLQDPSIVRKCQGLRSKKTSSARDNRLLLKAEGEIWCTHGGEVEFVEDVVKNGNDFIRESDKLTITSDHLDNTCVIEAKADSKRFEAKQFEANRRVKIQIERWSDQVNDEMKKGRIQRELRSDGPDTVICVDVSASMKGEAFVMAKTLVKSYITEIQNRPNTEGTYEHISLVTFGQQTTVKKHSTYEYYEILSALDSLRPEGPSPLYAGLKMCMAAIFAAGKVSSQHNDSVTSKVLLLTDGQVTPSEFIAGPDTCTEMEEKMEKDRVMSYCVDLHKKYHLTINVVCIGNSNVPFLESIAKKTCGELIMEEIQEKQFEKNKNESSAEVEITAEDSLMLEDETSIEDRELEERYLEVVSKQKEIEERKEQIQNYGGKRPGTPIPVDLLNRIEHIPFPYHVEVQSSSESSDSEVEIQTQETHDLFLPLGARVRTKADPLCGTVTKLFSNGVQVTWDKVSARGCIREDIYQPDCLEIVNQPRVLTDELIAVGCRVKRGIDWHYEDQDGHPGNEGVVIDVKDIGVIRVCWDHGPVYTYRFGSDGKFEIQVVQPNLRETLSEEPPLKDGSENEVASHILDQRSTNEATNTQESTDSTSYRWRWKDVNGKWNYFPVDINMAIENSYNNSNEGSIFIILRDRRYKILFTRMVKLDVLNKAKYPVSRTLLSS